MYVTRGEDDGWDPNYVPPAYGLDISDDTLIDLMIEVDGLYEREAAIREITPLALLEMRPSRSAMQQAAIDLVSRFWDDEVWIVIYEVNDAYGGPEEGGWTFPVYETVAQFRIEGDRVGEIGSKARNVRSHYQNVLNEKGDEIEGHFSVHVEVVPQGWERHNELNGASGDFAGPGKEEHNQRRQVYC